MSNSDANKKVKMNETAKKSYYKNRTKILKKMSEKVKCELCGCEYIRSSTSNHKKSKKHQMNEQMKQQEEKIRELETFKSKIDAIVK